MLSRSTSIFLFLVLLVEVGVGLVVISDLRDSYSEVERIYGGSVRGLQRIGELQYDAQETRRSTLYALTTNNGNLQVNYADQTREADHRVTEDIADYLRQARTPEEVGVGERLKDDWSTYLAVRDEVLGLILENSSKEAIDLDLSSGVPKFGQVHQDLEDIRRLYDQQASKRLATVADFSRRSVIRLTAALCFGLLFGSMAIWAIQQSRMRSALQFAKLQMDFVASVSHELRTPTAAILSAGENIRDGVVSEGEGLREHGSIIATQAGHLTELVDQVLLYATGKDRPWHEVRPLRVSEIVESSLENVAFLFEGTGFTAEQEIQSGLPLIDGDLSVVCQCLQNLLVNAVKYSGHSRSIGISAQIGETTKNGPEVRISVQDRGIGISDADLAHVFEPFYRSPHAIVARVRGTGLGLSIAKRCAEASGGRLTVVSEQGVGSIFTIHLPVSTLAGS
jgi:signal transduction histidine kinase